MSAKNMPAVRALLETADRFLNRVRWFNSGRGLCLFMESAACSAFA